MNRICSKLNSIHFFFFFFNFLLYKFYPVSFLIILIFRARPVVHLTTEFTVLPKIVDPNQCPSNTPWWVICCFWISLILLCKTILSFFFFVLQHNSNSVYVLHFEQWKQGFQEKYQWAFLISYLFLHSCDLSISKGFEFQSTLNLLDILCTDVNALHTGVFVKPECVSAF